MICHILYGRQHDAQADDERVEHERFRYWICC